MKTVPIPGGEAVLREPHEILMKHRALVQATSMEAAHGFAKIGEAPPPGTPERTAFDALTPTQRILQAPALTADEALAVIKTRWCALVVQLVSWTLTNEDGSPRPLPQSIDDVGEMETGLYDEIDTAIGAAIVDQSLGQVDFSPTTRAQKDSPTKGSGRSGSTSTRRQPSTRAGAAHQGSPAPGPRSPHPMAVQ